jgi:cytochrome b
VWGFNGSRYARFRNFLGKLPEIISYFKSLLTRTPRHYVGHNPAGGISILLLLILGVTTAATGWVEYEDWDISYIEEIHEVLANTMLSLVFLHVAAVLLSSFLHRENLIRAMLTGCKPCRESESIQKSHPMIAVTIMVAIILFWLWMYRSKWLYLMNAIGP